METLDLFAGDMNAIEDYQTLDGIPHVLMVNDHGELRWFPVRSLTIYGDLSEHD